MVYHGTAYKTPGGLKKCDLIQNKKTGRIVSKVKSMEAKKTRRLEKAGYRPVKGKFMLMKKGMGSKKIEPIEEDHKQYIIFINNTNYILHLYFKRSYIFEYGLKIYIRHFY